VSCEGLWGCEEWNGRNGGGAFKTTVVHHRPGILGWVFVEKWGIGVMHIGWAIAGAVLMLFSAVAISAGTISLLMKRMETRLSKRIRERE